MKKIGIILSGLGFAEGTSLWDIAYALREIEKCNAKPIPLVPRESIERSFPGSRRKNTPPRNFMNEASMMIRGDVYYLGDTQSKDIDVLFIPGGCGCINVLSSLYKDGTEAHILPELREFVAGVYAREKLIGCAGYGAALVAFILRARTQPVITMFDDAEISRVIKTTGADVVKIQPEEVVSDDENNIMSTPGTSPKASLYRASIGIEVMIRGLLDCNKKT